ncbi:tyrosine-type recombinase/integrase [Candidatus Poriferisodalis sp.]|uniref:tyrosine-type recombinase/integrase n=1 Tax=Candidatus Poriferisodalis sp. TaxID=3101277 RepID=UPI003B02DA6F
MTDRSVHKLTAQQVKGAPPGKHYDGAGLILIVKPSGARSWAVRLMLDGRQKDYGLGGYPTVSLGEARRKAAEMRDRVRAGTDPLAVRRSAVPTFSDAVELLYRQKLPNFRNPQRAHEWRVRLTLHAEPHIGSKPVDMIGRADVLEVLDRIWTDKPPTAVKVRGAMAQVFRFAMGRGWIDRNPAGEMIDGAYERQPAGGNMASMPFGEVPALMELLTDHDGSDVARMLLAFTILTAARPGEARGARWPEIDLNAETWTVPAERMKAHKEHTVPLSRPALAVLELADRLRLPGSEVVFPSSHDNTRPLGHSTATHRLRQLGIATATVHGFRSSFRTWALENGAPWAAAEMSLAHRVGNDVEARYIRSDLIDQRRKLLADWGDFCTMPAAVEIPDTAELLTRS